MFRTLIVPTPRKLAGFHLSLSYWFFAFRCPSLAVEYTVAIPVYEGILTLIVLSSFANATFRDPGIIPRGREAR